jgi:callose synthase
VVDALQNLYEELVQDFPYDSSVLENLREHSSTSQSDAEVLLFMEAVDLPASDEEAFFKQLRRLHTSLSTTDALLNVPKGLEARRRISFFCNSLFMTMPRAPQVEKMLAFSVLTPYYSEEVIFSKQQLKEENEDGVYIVFYLQKIFPGIFEQEIAYIIVYQLSACSGGIFLTLCMHTLLADDWDNFLERMNKIGLKESELWDDDAFELRMWASYRGQTLARTVRGMMYYERSVSIQELLVKGFDVCMQ